MAPLRASAGRPRTNLCSCLPAKLTTSRRVSRLSCFPTTARRFQAASSIRRPTIIRTVLDPNPSSPNYNTALGTANEILGHRELRRLHSFAGSAGTGCTECCHPKWEPVVFFRGMCALPLHHVDQRYVSLHWHEQRRLPSLQRFCHPSYGPRPGGRHQPGWCRTRSVPHRTFVGRGSEAIFLARWPHRGFAAGDPATRQFRLRSQHSRSAVQQTYSAATTGHSEFCVFFVKEIGWEGGSVRWLFVSTKERCRSIRS